MKYLFLFILILHAVIHLAGFIHSVGMVRLSSLHLPVSLNVGRISLVAALTLLFSAAFFIMEKQWWYWVWISVFCSQVFIVLMWTDAKPGTIVNVILVLISLAGYFTNRFEQQFRRDAVALLEECRDLPDQPITASDLSRLPLPVQRYLRLSGAEENPKVNIFSIRLSGEMRQRKKAGFPFTSVQYNAIRRPVRLFFMKGKMFGITVPGYHKYVNGKAVMDIRLFGLFKVVYFDGPVLDKTETVTWLNDICMMAPLALTDERFKWKPMDDTTAIVQVTVGENTVSAELHFNKDGMLENFISMDRTEVNEMKQLQFSTPVNSWMKERDIVRFKQGEGVWHYPEGAFSYGTFINQGYSQNKNVVIH